MHNQLALWALAAALIAGCGKSDTPPTGSVAKAPVSNVAASADQAASADDVAKAARGAVSCPPKIATPPRADTAPVDDVLGVRPGQRYEEAVNGVLCAHDLLVATREANRGFELRGWGAQVRQGFSARFAEERVVRTGKQIVQDMQRDAMARGLNTVREDLKPGQSKWFVGTMGMPGEERVLSVAREERFASDQNPTVDAVRAALLKKYGPASFEQPPNNVIHGALRWARDPQGRPVVAGSPLASRCFTSADPNAGVNLNPECGLVVEALMIPTQANPALVDRLQVAVVDKAAGYQMIQATEQGLAQKDMQRRVQEVDKAAKNAKAPSL